jgi:hypothetical protein
MSAAKRLCHTAGRYPIDLHLEDNKYERPGKSRYQPFKRPVYPVRPVLSLPYIFFAVLFHSLP